MYLSELLAEDVNELLQEGSDSSLFIASSLQSFHIDSSVSVNQVEPKRYTPVYLAKYLNSENAQQIYDYLTTHIDWQSQPAITSSKTRQITRLGYSVSPNDDAKLLEWLFVTLRHDLCTRLSVRYLRILGVYLNYYPDGSSWAPEHTHPGTHQIIISLGGSRLLSIGRQKYLLTHGDCILFGSGKHGVPQTTEKVAPRISIALFVHLYA